MTSILIISSSILGEGLRMILERQKDWQVRLFPPSDPEAIAELCLSYQPHVTILDAISLKSFALFEALDRPGVKLLGRTIVVTLGGIDEETLFLLMKWGVAACPRATTTPETLLTIVERVSHDEWLLSLDLLTTGGSGASRLPTREAGGQGRAPAASRKTADQAPVLVTSPLSQRETDILTLIAQGKRNKHIADTFHVSELTLKNWLTALYKKLGVANRTAAVVAALRQRWIEMSPCSCSVPAQEATAAAA